VSGAQDFLQIPELLTKRYCITTSGDFLLVVNVNPFNPDFLINITSLYHTVNALYLRYKTDQLLLYREIIIVCSEIHTKHINALCEQNVELYLYIKIQSVLRSKHIASRL
jgi:hypothetical protein